MIRRWIPNTLTFGNLLSGFLSVTVASSVVDINSASAVNLFLVSGFLILLATVFDGLDGAVARALGVQSSLGEQLDSLADLTTFGVAPAFLLYKISLFQIVIPFSFFDNPKNFPLGMLVASIYPMATAFRLARFNIGHSANSFTGLPSPIAGLFVAFFPFFANQYPVSLWYTVPIMLALSFLMVSNLRYSKVTVTIRSHLTRLRIILFVGILILSFLLLKWYFIIVAFLILYIFSGILGILFHILQKIKIGAFSR